MTNQTPSTRADRRRRQRRRGRAIRWGAAIGVLALAGGLAVAARQVNGGEDRAVGQVRIEEAAPAPTAPEALPTAVATTAPKPTPSATSTRITAPRRPAARTTTTTADTETANGGPGRVADCLTRRGIPSCGVFVGAAIDGNADPSAREAQFGSRLALRRTYYQASGVEKAVATARSDLAAGRLPWISFKLPHSWAEMAGGAGDAWARDLATRLSRLDGPVWIAFHHEPEKDGSIADWTRMQRHLSPIIRNTAGNVAFTLITTGWNQVFGSDPSYRLESLWPGDGLVDIMAFDPYNEYGVTKNGRTIDDFVELKEYYRVLAAFAEKHRTAWAIGETGYTDQGAAKDRDWLPRAVRDMDAMGGVGLAYFDSILNSQGSWPLDTPAKISAFRTALGHTIRLTP